MKKYYTSEELIAEMKKLGIRLLDRKLKYYVSLGIVPKPVKNLPGLDGRVAYYPAASVERLVKIRELQESGFTLTQIRRYFDNSIEAPLKDFLHEQEKSAPLSLDYVMDILSGDSVKQAAEEFRIDILSGEDESAFEMAAQRYYIKLLSQIVPEQSARTYVEHLFQRADVQVKERKLEPLRRLKTKYESSSGASSLSNVLIGLCRQLKTGDYDEVKMLERLKELAQQVHTMQEKSRLTLQPFKPMVDISRFITQAFWLYYKALLELELFVKDNEPEHLDRALRLSFKSDEILSQLEFVVNDIKKILLLYDESEKL